MKERLQKILSKAGISSRRKAEEIILQGKVTVNGQVIKTLGCKVDPDSDKIKVEGKNLNEDRKITYILNKPPGYICSSYDPQKRKRVVELLVEAKEKRLYTVGRLDYQTRGLILVTNDGDLAYSLTHPSYETPKTYQVLTDSSILAHHIEQLEKGVIIDGRRVVISQIKDFERFKNKIEITIVEGRKRIVRKIFAKMGLKVVDLKRIKVGFLSLGDLKEGEYRELTTAEIKKLKLKNKGFSLLEVVASLAIFSVGILSVALFFPSGIEASKKVKDYTKAVFFGQAKMEELKAQNYSTIVNSSGDFMIYCEDIANHAKDYRGFAWETEVNSYSETLSGSAKSQGYKKVDVIVYWPEYANAAYNDSFHQALRFNRIFCERKDIPS